MPKDKNKSKNIQGNHRKIIGPNMGIIMAIFGSNMGEMCLNKTFRSFLELICFDLVK